MQTMQRFPILAGLLLAGVIGGPATAAQWADSELQLLRGTAFAEPGAGGDVGKSIATLSHASGHDWGRLFGFLDYSRFDAAGGGEEDFYGELYASFGRAEPLAAGPLRDVKLTLGANYGENTGGANPRVLLPGLTFDLALPGFAYFNVDVLAYVDRGRFNGAATACNGESWQITPAWKYPFRVGALAMSLEGFADWIGAHGACAGQFLSQPQLRLDLGALAGAPERLYLGVEYQYWRNKYGIKGLDEHFPQALALLKF